MKKLFASITVGFLLVLPLFALLQTTARAQTAPAGNTPVLQNPIKYDNFSDFVAGVTQTAVKVLLPFVVLAFIYSGFLFVKAQGNPGDLEKAKSAILWSSVGALILFGAWGFAQIIKTTISAVTN